MTMIRTVFAGALALAFAVAFAGCGGDSPTTPAPGPAPAPAPAPAPEPAPAPAPRGVPAGLAVSATGPGFIEWSWSPLEGAEGYQVQFSPDAFFTADDEVVDRTAEETSYRRENLPAGTSAHLRVRASTGAGEERLFGDWSASVSGRSPIPVPSGLAVSATGGDFIEWNWDAVEGAAGYQVQYSPDARFTEEDEIVDRTPGQLSWRKEDLPYRTLGHVRVRTLLQVGFQRLSGDWSAEVPGVTDPPSAEPGTVTGIEVADVGPDFVLWSWDPVPGAIRYEVRVYPNGGYEWDLVRVEEPFLLVDGLEPGAVVKIRVQAIADSGRGLPWSKYALAETLPPSARVCTNERELAARYSRFVSEWDGTPFRVDLIRDGFPEFVTEAGLVELLEPVGLLADKIEQQLGYRIVEKGAVISVPEGTPPGWNEDILEFGRTCPVPRERGQVHFFYLDNYFPSNPKVGAVARPDCGAFAITKYRVEQSSWRPYLWGGPVMHELFHVFGFRHIDEYDRPDGVPMSRALDDSSQTPGAQSATWEDIEMLRCIFPREE